MITKKKIFLVSMFIVILLLGVTVVSASTNTTKITKDTNPTKVIKNTDNKVQKTVLTKDNILNKNNTKKVTKSVTKEKTSKDITKKDNVEKTVKNITKKVNSNKNVKTATEITVNTYDDLYDALTTGTDSKVSIDIKSDLTATKTIEFRKTLSEVVIEGNNKTIYGDENHIFNISGDINVTIKKLNLVNASAPSGGAIYTRYANLTVNDCSFKDNKGDHGAAIVIESSYYSSENFLTVIGSTFENNYVNRGGGAIYIDTNTNLIIKDSYFENNTAVNEGGVIYAHTGKININNTTFVNNKVTGNPDDYPTGGVLMATVETNTVINNSKFINNSCTCLGGVIENYYDSILKVDNSLFSGNEALYGGAIDNADASLTVTNSNFTSNKAKQRGGSINSEDYTETTVFILTGNTFINDSSPKGNEISNYYNLTMNDNTFINNNIGFADFMYNTTVTKGSNNKFYTNNTTEVTDKNGDELITSLEKVVNVSDRTTGDISKILVNDEEKTLSYSTDTGEQGIDFKFTFNNGDLPLGKTNDIHVFYQNTIDIGTEYSETSFDIKAISTTQLKITNVESDSYKDKVNITGTLLDANNNPIDNMTVDVYVDNVKKGTAKTDSTGTFTYSFDDASVGDHVVNVTFVKSGNYLGNDTAKEVSFTVKAKDTKITLDDIEDIKIGQTATIKGTLTDKDGQTLANMSVSIVVDAENIANVTTNDKGIFTYDYTPTQTGDKTVIVSFDGNKNYTESEDKNSFKVKKISSTISVDDISDAKLGDEVTVKGKLVDENNKPIADKTVTINVNGKDYNVTTDSDGTFKKTVTADTLGKNNVSVSYDGSDKIESSSAKTTYNVAGKVSSKLSLDPIKDTTVGDKAKVSGKLVDEDGKAISGATIKVIVDGKTYNTTTNKDGSFTVNALTNKSGKQKVKVTYDGDLLHNSTSASATVKVDKNDVLVKVNKVTGIIGEKIKFVATVTDKKGNKITGGNLVFKLNGVTFNNKKRFDNTSKTPYKLSVKNGKVTLTITADVYLKNGGDITASYSGTDAYNSAKSNVAKLTIKLRSMKISVKAQPSKVKQYKNVTFTVTLTDTTKNTKNKTAIKDNTSVLFKINGKTIKVKGKQVNVKVKSNKVIYSYTIPRGTAGIYENKTIRNYNVTAKYESKIFSKKNNSNNTKYNVARSKITVTINKATLKNNKLSINGNIKDYMKKYVKGTSKICIKIDGKTYKVNNKAKIFKVKNGKINIKGIKIANPSTIKKVSIVSGERVAYFKGESKAKKILKI